MRLKKASHFATIGAFIVACISAVISVWAIYLQQSAQGQPTPEGASVMRAWIMPSIFAFLGLCILVAAVLHFLAARMSRDTKPDRKKDKQQGDSTPSENPNDKIIEQYKTKTEHLELEVLARANERDAFKSELDTLQTNYGKQHKITDDHVNDVSSRIKVEIYFSLYERSSQPLRLYMGLSIYNNSVFDITIKDQIMIGHIKFWGEALLEGKRINPSSTTIPALDHGKITIEQNITQQEYDRIGGYEIGLTGVTFNFDQLTMMVEVDTPYPELKTARLVIPPIYYRDRRRCCIKQGDDRTGILEL